MCIKLSNPDSVMEDLTKKKGGKELLQEIKRNLKYFFFLYIYIKIHHLDFSRCFGTLPLEAAVEECPGLGAGGSH